MRKNEHDGCSLHIVCRAGTFQAGVERDSCQYSLRRDCACTKCAANGWGNIGPPAHEDGHIQTRPLSESDIASSSKELLLGTSSLV